MAQCVIVKKSEKVNKVFSVLGSDCSFEMFRDKFKTDYPDDWNRICKRYEQHEIREKKEKDIRCLILSNT